MRALFAALSLAAFTGTAFAGEETLAFLDHSPPPPDYVGGLGLITLMGPTGMFLNPTSGIAAKNTFSVESCMTFRKNGDDHFHANGVLVEYGVTDWLEIGALGLFVRDIDPAGPGKSELNSGQLNARVRLLREQGFLPEVSVGGLGDWGDKPLQAYHAYVAASKGFALSSGDFFKSVRFHAGFREDLPELGKDISSGYGGVEIELYKHVFLVSEVSTKDSSQLKTPWSIGLQYKGGGFGFSAAMVQTPDDTDKAFYVGIGVSY